MANHLKDRMGMRFGRLTVIGRAPSNATHSFWWCVCDCDLTVEVVIRADVLDRTKGIRNCGCLKAEKARLLARKPDDAIGYLAAHDRVRKARGNARLHTCASCSRPATDWALRKDAQASRIATSGASAGYPFSPNVADYQPMCRSCHSRYDLNMPWRPQPKAIGELRSGILGGKYAAGAQLPRIDEIAHTCGVGKTTVYRALGVLISAGLVELVNHRYFVTDADGWRF